MNTTKNVYCRLCAELKPHIELTNLQTDEETCQKVVNKLSRFNIVMDFQENILPKTVCLICLKSLEQASAFVTAVEQAQVFLSDINLVETRSVNNECYGETTFYGPSDDVFDDEVENSRDPMDVNDNDDEELDNEDFSNVQNDDEDFSNVQNDDEDFSNVQNDDEDFSNVQNDDEDFSNVQNDDGNNKLLPSTSLLLSLLLSKDSENVYTKNKNTKQYSYVIAEEEIGETGEYTDINNIKDNESLNFSNDCRDNQFTDVGENDLNIKDAKIPSGVEEKLRKDTLITALNSEPIPPSDNLVNSADCMNKQNNSNVDTNPLGSGAPHEQKQPICKPIPPKLLDTVYSEDDTNDKISTLCTVPVQCLKKTWMDYEWKCSHCGTLFSNIEELQKHSMLYHNTCNAYQCTDCNMRKERLNAFIQHVRTHRKYLHYSCYKCFEKFPKPMGRSKLHIHHENSKHVCLGCNTSFSSNTDLEEHVNKYYKLVRGKNTSMNSDNLTCSTCEKVFANITALRTHFKTHKENKENRVCDRCGKCIRKDYLKIHMETIHIKKTYQCEICKQNFTKLASLKSHASIHSGIKPFTCDVCSKRFRTKRQVINHMQVHTDCLPITCTLCNKKFRRDLYLQRHMLQHTGEKPYSCDICPRDFTNLPNRNKHMRRRHGIEMGKKRQAIIKQQTTDDPTSSDQPGQTRETKFADVDKMERKNKIMGHRKSQRINSKLIKEKVINKECNEN